MNAKPTQSELSDEIARYLDAVELFRSLDCEPHWRSETQASADAAVDARAIDRRTTSAH